LSTRGRYLRIAAALVIVGACNNATESAAVSEIVVQPDTIVIQRGSSVQLTASALDNQGHLITGVAVVFSSSDTTVFTVSNLGVLLARKKGSAHVVVSAGGVAGHVPVTVFVSATLVVGPADTAIRQGRSFPIRAAVRDSGGDSIPGFPRSFAALDSTIAKVSSTGVVTGVGTGQAYVEVHAGALDSYVHVTVHDSTFVATVPVSGQPFELATKGSNTYLSTIGDVVHFNLATLAVGASIHGTLSAPVRLVFNAAGDRLYVGDIGAARVWVVNVATDSVIDSVATTGSPAPLAIIGGALFVATDANRLYKFDLGTKLATDSISLPATAHQVLAHPNDTTLYVATRDGGTVMEVNARTMTATRTFTIGGRTQAMALSPDHQTLYVANEINPYVYVVALGTGTVTDSIPLAGGAYGLAISGDGARLYASLSYAGAVQVLNVAARSVIKTYGLGGTPREVLFDATHQHVLVPNEGGWVDVLLP